MKRRTKTLLILASLTLVGLLSSSQSGKVKQSLYYHWGLNGVTEIYKLSVARIPEGKDVFFEGDGLRIAATLFSSGENRAPGVIFLHGSSTKGRKLPFALLLCQRMAEHGVHVLSMDMRGFGESEDPELIDSPDSWQSKVDVRRALDFLIQNANVDTHKLFVVGHSAGANQAIIAGIHDDRIKKIVAIGPSRRVKERVLSNTEQERKYFVDRFARDRRLNESLSWETYRQVAINAMMDTYVPYFQTHGHKPIFLIDGSLEDKADLTFLQNIFQELVPPKKHLTIEGSNHYSNTKELGPFILYHKQVFNELVVSIMTWLKEG